MARIRVGTVFTGEVDRINQESIQTKFFIFGLPLFPLESYYCLRVSRQGIQGFPIKLNLKSVIITYLRWWIGTGSVLGILLGLVAQDTFLLLPPIIGLALALSTIWTGRLSKQEKQRRQVLINVTGMGAPPDLLTHSTVCEVSARLENAWKQSPYGVYQGSWQNIRSLNSVPKNMLPLLFCLALYGKNSQMAEKAWQAIEANIRSQQNQTP